MIIRVRDESGNFIIIPLGQISKSEFEVQLKLKADKSEVYSKEEVDTKKQEIVDYLNERIGDIDSALDAIIAIQNELIGGES